MTAQTVNVEFGGHSSLDIELSQRRLTLSATGRLRPNYTAY
jgi:hypothetical protein